MSARSSPGRALTLVAALVGTLPLALYAPLLLAQKLPASDEARAALALFLPVPLYVVSACVVMRLRAPQAWAACVVLGVAAALAVS
jgi:hypothetical protein